MQNLLWSGRFSFGWKEACRQVKVWKVGMWVSVWAVVSAGAWGEDWPDWRGPGREARCQEKGLLQYWPQQGPPLLWHVQGLGHGYSTVAVSNGRVFTTGKRPDGVYLVALDEQTGRKLWQRRLASSGGANSTPVVDQQRVYALSTEGELVCCHVEDGRVLWRKSFPRDFGGKMMSGWGYSETPLVDGPWLVCTPGGPQAAIVALDKLTGEVIWQARVPPLGPRGRDGAGYSSIVISHGGGVKQYIQLMGRGLVSVRAQDGKFLWGYNRVANSTANIPTPLVQGDYVFASSGYGTGAVLLRLHSAGPGLVRAQEVYFLPARVFQNHHGGMVLLGRYVFAGHGHNQGFPICLDLLTGRRVWFGGRGPGSGSAAVLYADGHLYFKYQNGVIALIEATPKGYRLKSSFKMPTRDNRNWAHPVVANGRLYLRSLGELFCHDVRRR